MGLVDWGMADNIYVELPERGVLTVAGPDARSFLQGLISNDVMRAAPDRAVHAALLTAQGRYLHDFFIVEIGGTLHLDCEAARRDDLLKRLKLYKLRSKVTLEDATERMTVIAIPATTFGLNAEAGAGKPFGGGAVFVDPRLAAIGARAILPRESAATDLSAAGLVAGDRGSYEKLRLALGLPDSSRDLEVERSILLENGFDELNGVDWKKGCYVGQELTARTKYRGLIKKRLMPVRIDGPAPTPGTPITYGEQEAGEMRSASDGLGLALLRLEFLEKLGTDGGTLVAGNAKLTPAKPDWLLL